MYNLIWIICFVSQKLLMTWRIKYLYSLLSVFSSFSSVRLICRLYSGTEFSLRVNTVRLQLCMEKNCPSWQGGTSLILVPHCFFYKVMHTYKALYTRLFCRSLAMLLFCKLFGFVYGSLIFTMTSLKKIVPLNSLFVGH